MFFVIRRDKLNTYLISVVTIILLFSIGGFLQSQVTVETISENRKLLPIYNVQTDENKVALTLNCAWNDNDIDEILSILEANNIKITFFMVGEWIEEYTEAATKIYEAGHELAIHSDTHPHVNELSYSQNVTEIVEANKKVEEITGKATKLYRTPYGEYNDIVIKAAQDNGYYTIQWNHDTLDYTGITGEQMWARLDNKLENGDIILAHNGTRHTADSLDMIIKNIKEEGFEITPVSKIIYLEDYTIDSNGTQIKEK